MSRKPRVLFCDRVAHCFIHAVDDVWFDENDFQIFRRVLQKLVKKHHISILYFSFMSTHVHTILKFSEDISCGKLMSIVNGGLSKAYNRGHSRRGHTWAERFGDVTIEEESHFFAAFLYVAMNKRKAGMVDSFEQDIYSSYPVYAQGHDDGITTVAEEYLELGPTPAERQSEFRQMLNENWQRFRDANYWGKVDTDTEDSIACGRVDLKKMLCISDHIDELLAKHTHKKPGAQAEVISEELEDAQEKVRARIKETRQEIVMRLSCMGASGSIINSFWATDDFILQFVDSHRRHFGLGSIPAG